MTSTGFLSLTDVEIGYGTGDDRVTAVSGLCLDVRHRELVAVVGPSGCGKTTLLKALGGLLPVTGGEVAWLRAEAPRTATVFQSPRLLAWASVLDNVAFGLEALGVGRAEARRRGLALLGRVGLAEWAPRYPRELSGGMQQRVNLARALAVEPDLLLLDEPFAALDAQTRDRMQLDLAEVVQREEATGLLVTHQVDEAVFLADRVVVLSSRPARVVLEVTVPFDQPRRLRLKRDVAFRRIEDEVWEALHDHLTGIEAAS